MSLSRTEELKMIRELALALRACAVTFVLCAVAYPAVVWGAAQLLFPFQANGSLIYGADGRTVIGSELIAQKLESDRYFHPRPSAADYKADAAGGSNLGTNNPELHKTVAARVTALNGTPENPVPVDLVTASGSGLDPDVSPEAAQFQAPRIAAARGVPIDTVRGLIERETVHSGAIVGAPPRANVLLLNLALDKQYDAVIHKPHSAE
jgi:potassium-transporting ATPase KdpC subunit